MPICTGATGATDQLAELDRRGRGALRVVTVGDRCTERSVDVAALVADGDLQDVALVAVQDGLHGADELVELLLGVGVAVVVDALEADEQRHGRPQLGEELAHAAAEAVGDRRDEPVHDQLCRQRVVGQRRPRIDRHGRRASHRPRRTGRPWPGRRATRRCRSRRRAAAAAG